MAFWLSSGKKKMSKENFRNLGFLILALLYLGSFYPSFYNQFWFGHAGVLFSMGIACIWFIFLIPRLTCKIIFPEKSFTILMIVLLFYYCFRLVLYHENVRETVIELFVNWIVIFLVINSFRPGVFPKYFLKWNIIMLCSTLIGMLLLIIGRLPLLSTCDVGEHTAVMYNFGFFFIKTNYKWADALGAVRSAGFYDEPGSFAYVIMLLLIYNKLHFNNKKYELFLLLGGMLTLSMAHFITVIVYILLFYSYHKKGIFILTVFLFLMLFFYWWKPEDDPILFHLWDSTFGRFERFLEGNDVSRNYNAAFDAFKTYFLTGASDKEILSNFPDATPTTLWYILAQNGLTGIILYLLPFIYVTINAVLKKNLTELKLLFIFFLNFGQRPFYIYPIYFLMIYFIWFERKTTSTVPRYATRSDF